MARSLPLTARTTTLAGFANTTHQPEVDAGAALVRGDSLDRYVVLGCLGVGGMGVVYAAYDPDLDRRVAIKLLRQELFSTPAGEVSRRRLLREAQALARLAHPNVVTVFDAGVVDEQVFVAMEYVTGQDLRQWSGGERRSWREVLAVYRQAGRGLAAAHDAALVHRDFKPGNAILGDDGRVRVLDFGLARPVAAAAAGESAVDDPTVRFGTPAFMAPEQDGGGAGDPRSDQFSFCCALYEALYGAAPFVGLDPAERATAKRRGEIQPPPSGARVPSWVHAAVVRGLAPRPESRHASMHDLVAVLGQDPAERRRRWAAALVVFSLALVLGMGWRRSARSQAQLCLDADKHLRGLWDPAIKADARQAFLGTGLSFAGAAFSGVAETLDGYVEGWVQMRGEACEATHLRGEQSMELLDLRMSCLDQRLQEVAATTRLLVDADGMVVERAATLATGLSSLEGCADTERLRAVVKPPDDPRLVAGVARVRETLARARSLHLAGRPADALVLARQAVAASEPLGHAPLRAETHFLLGFMHLILGDFEASDEAFRMSWQQAEAGRHHEVKVGALLYLAWSAMSQRQGLEASRERLDIADGAIRGLSDPADLRNRWYYTSAFVHNAAGHHEQAADYAARAVAGGRNLLGPDHLMVANYLNLLGSVLLSQGLAEEALEHHREVERIQRLALGEGHPTMGTAYQNLGRNYLELGRLVEAEEILERAHGLMVESFGAESKPAVTVMHDLGTIDIKLGRYHRALTKHREALAIRRRLQDPYETARSLNMIGLALTRSGKTAEAEEALNEALRIAETTRGTEDPVLAYYLTNLGELRMVTGGFREAVAVLHRARALNSSASVQVEVDTRLGLIDLETDRLPSARQRLEKAVKELKKSDRLSWADAHFALARTLNGLGEASGRARALALEARTAYRDLAEETQRVADVDAWLARFAPAETSVASP